MAKPEWLKVRVRSTREAAEVKEMLKRLSLHTVCEEAACPNIMECFGRRTAALMILGRVCTRNCTFCNVTKGTADPVDPLEPQNAAEAAADLNLKHVVITSVTRDDLPDGGAAQFAACIREIKRRSPQMTVEVLIPDLQGNKEALSIVLDACPDILNHNIETVPRLYPQVRPMARYARSLALLSRAKAINPAVITKSGIMLGLGEMRDEVLSALQDLRSAGCEVLTIGQYLAPTSAHYPVVEYVPPEEFDFLRQQGEAMGFRYVASAPLVRSSYLADQALNTQGQGRGTGDGPLSHFMLEVFASYMAPKGGC